MSANVLVISSSAQDFEESVGMSAIFFFFYFFFIVGLCCCCPRMECFRVYTQSRCRVEG